MGIRALGEGIWKSLLRKDHTSLKSRLLNGAFWSVLGAVGGKGLVLIAFIIVARIIGQRAYGEFGIIRSTINMFTVFASAGIGYTASKYIAQHRNRQPQAAGEIYALSNVLAWAIGFLFALLLVAFSSLIAERSLQNPLLADDIKWGALVLFFTTLNGVQNGALSGFEAFKPIAVNTFLSGLFQSICLVAGCYFWGIEGCIAGLGLGCVALYFLNHYSIRRYLKQYAIVPEVRRVKKQTWRVLWKFSFPAILSSVMVLPVLWWAKTYLVRQAGYVEMADFDVADQWGVMVLFIPATLSQVILPLLSNTLEEGTTGQYFRLIRVNILLNVVISSFIALGVIVLGKYILSFYGKGFVEVQPLIYMMIATVIMSACHVVGQVFASQDKMWLGVMFNFIWAVWIVIFTILLVGNGYGAGGLALAIVFSYVLHFIFQGIYIFKFLKKQELCKK